MFFNKLAALHAVYFLYMAAAQQATGLTGFALKVGKNKPWFQGCHSPNPKKIAARAKCLSRAVMPVLGR